MKEKGDLERYLLERGQPYEEGGDGIYGLHDEADQVVNIVVTWAPPLVIFRVKLMDLPEGDNAALMRKLLELNANDMVAGAYGLEGNSLVVVDSLQSENMDYNEFQASIESLAMSITVHFPILKVFF